MSPISTTPEPMFLTAADARRMEAAEEHAAVHHARFTRKMRPGAGAAWEEFGGGHLAFVAKGSPVGRAHGLGFAGKVTPQDIEHVEHFYFERQSDAQVDVCPYADPSLFESLNQRGFYVAEFNMTLARWISPRDEFASQPQQIELRRIRRGEETAWIALLAKVFFAQQAVQFEELFLPWASAENPMCLAAFLGGKMVAGAGGILIPEHRMAGCFGAVTLPEFRGRGLQRAFLAARLLAAQQAGCDLAVTLTMPGTISQRNAERAGFRTAYTKVVVKKPFSPAVAASPDPPTIPR
ncbi:MAG TPA: GNAT family N-acetyltransferase [Candidatus Angelobacter sp.]|nr:GNAT family N-acetyltransferase [Candidatus Angelobacter sp.]